MTTLKRYTSVLFKWIVTAVFLAPMLTWAHGALDTPVSRAVNCQIKGGYWQSTDGSSIVDAGCREASMIFNNNAAWAYPFQQWNEVAKIPEIHHPTMAQIQSIIKDEQICAAGDPRKASLDEPTPNWTKTTVTPGQPLTMRLIGTAPHVPSTFYAFVTKAGFDTATTKLKWSDLTALGQAESFTVAKTNWTVPAKISGASGFFEIVRNIPPGLSGNGLIVGIWVRDDPNGEFFISCSDVKFQGGGIPLPFHNIGAFIDPDMRTLKPGDSVHFRILSDDPSANELVNIIHLITVANLAPGQWGQEIANMVDPNIAKIGEEVNQNIVFNPVNPLINATFAAKTGYTQAMSIKPGSGTGPVNPAPPVARITGPTSLKSDEAFTFSGTGSTGNNGPLLYSWTVPGMQGHTNAGSVSGKASTVTTPTPMKARLLVRDPQNGKTHNTEFDFNVVPKGDGGGYPAYKEGDNYKDGDIVTHQGKTYKCKPHPYTAWCAGAAWAYAPGTGTAWQQAWKPYP